MTSQKHRRSQRSHLRILFLQRRTRRRATLRPSQANAASFSPHDRKARHAHSTSRRPNPKKVRCSFAKKAVSDGLTAMSYFSKEGRVFTSQFLGRLESRRTTLVLNH